MALLLAAGAGLLLTACGSNATAGGSAITSTATPASAECGVYLSNGDARVFTADGDDLCRQLSSDLSSAGTYWNLQPHPVANALGLVCVMVRAGQTLRVEDSGTAIYGRDVCASLLNNHWQEDTAAEQAVSASAQARAQADAEASAQQEASASASTHLSLRLQAGPDGPDRATTQPATAPYRSAPGRQPAAGAYKEAARLSRQATEDNKNRRAHRRGSAPAPPALASEIRQLVSAAFPSARAPEGLHRPGRGRQLHDIPHRPARWQPHPGRCRDEPARADESAL